MGSVGSYRQFSFLSDDADTRVSLFVTPCVFINHVCLPQSQPRAHCKPQVFLWGGGVPVPQLLSHPPESVITDVAIGRSQRLGLTEDGKLLLWEVHAWIQQSHIAFHSFSALIRLTQYYSIHHDTVSTTE